MDEILQFSSGAIKRHIALKEANTASDQHEKLCERIRQLLRESNGAKEKGHWKKAHDLLLELSKITRNNI
jgi:hypothetical protein